MHRPMKGWWCLHRKPMDELDEAVFLSLPEDLEKLYLAEGECDDGYGLLFNRAGGDDPRSDEQIQQDLANHPIFATCKEVWILAFGDEDKPTWHELDEYEEPWDFVSTAKSLWTVDRDLNSCGEGWFFHVYAKREDAWADLASSYPRVGLLQALANQRADPLAKLARSILDGDEQVLAILADALEEAGDERADTVRSWLAWKQEA